jgi:hypothetical protein
MGHPDNAIYVANADRRKKLSTIYFSIPTRGLETPKTGQEKQNKPQTTTINTLSKATSQNFPQLNI